jgi:antitoxin HicB
VASFLLKELFRMSIYSIRLYLEPNETGVYTVTSPDIPGLVTEGTTPEEIQANVQEALEGLKEAWQEMGMNLPPVLRPALKDRPQTVDLLVTA